MEICLNCYSLKTHRIDKNIVCEKCSHIQSIRSYLGIQRKARNAVRNGYLFRIRYENDKKRQVANKAYSLIDLNIAFDFFATAIISGIAGNFAYDQLKRIFKKIGKNRIIIQIDDTRLHRFLKSERQQEKFIKYIQEYRDKKIKPPVAVKKLKNKKGEA